LAREMVWVERERFQGWACSVCEWVFRGSGALGDKSIEILVKKYATERDKAFTSHVCVAHPRERGALR
jgi:rubredoxin